MLLSAHAFTTDEDVKLLAAVATPPITVAPAINPIVNFERVLRP